MRTLGCLVAGFALLVASVTLAESFEPKSVPADAKWVIHIDVDAISQSAIWPLVQKRIDNNPQVQQNINEVERFSGMTLPRDLHSATIYGLGGEEKDGVILFTANANQQQLLTLLQNNPSFASEVYGSHEILTWEDKGKLMHGSFFSPTCIVISQDKLNVSKALDVLDGKAPALKAESVLAQPAGAGVLAGIAADGIPTLVKKNNPTSPIVKQIQSAWITLGIDGQNNLVAQSTLTTLDATRTEQLRNLVEGLKALGMMAGANDNAEPKIKDLGQLLTSLQIKAQNTSVKLSWTVPLEQIQKLAEQAEAARLTKTATTPKQ